MILHISAKPKLPTTHWKTATKRYIKDPQPHTNTRFDTSATQEITLVLLHQKVELTRWLVTTAY